MLPKLLLLPITRHQPRFWYPITTAPTPTSRLTVGPFLQLIPFEEFRNVSCDCHASCISRPMHPVSQVGWLDRHLSDGVAMPWRSAYFVLNCWGNRVPQPCWSAINNSNKSDNHPRSVTNARRPYSKTSCVASTGDLQSYGVPNCLNPRASSTDSIKSTLMLMVHIVLEQRHGR